MLKGLRFFKQVDFRDWNGLVGTGLDYRFVAFLCTLRETVELCNGLCGLEQTRNSSLSPARAKTPKIQHSRPAQQHRVGRGFGGASG